MCGIAGWSASSTSTIPFRQLAHHLLALSEARGRDASGWAFQTGDVVTTYKRAVPGGKLRVRSLPNAPRTVILHTRNTTVGDVSNNANNHPVVSPSKRISLIHNGVVTNHDSFREHYPDLPEVDSAVIPSLLEEFGPQGLSELSSSSWAALAWLDTQTPDTLHLATTQGAPLILVGLIDGTLLFASTFEAILGAMKAVGIESMFSWGYSAPQFTHLRVVAGSICFMENIPEYTFGKARFKPTAKIMTKAEIDRLHHITSGEIASKDSPPVATFKPVATKTPAVYTPPPVTVIRKEGVTTYSGGSSYQSAPTRDPNGPNAWATGEMADIMEQLDRKVVAPQPPKYVPGSNIAGAKPNWGDRAQFPHWLCEPKDLHNRIIYWLQTAQDPLPYVGFRDFDEFWEALDDWLTFTEGDAPEVREFSCGIISPQGEVVNMNVNLPANLALSPHAFFTRARAILGGVNNSSDFSSTQLVTRSEHLVSPPPGLTAEEYLEQQQLSYLNEEPDTDLVLAKLAAEVDDDDDAWMERFPRFQSASDEFEEVNRFLKEEVVDTDEGEDFLLPPQTFGTTLSGKYKEVKRK